MPDAFLCWLALWLFRFGEEGEYQPDTKITATGLIFPILCHEIIKGLEEATGRHGLPTDPSMRQKVMGQTDTLANEPMQLRIGPEIVEQLRFVLPDEMFDTKNKGLIVFFKIELYKMPAKEILGIVGNAISEDSSKVNKAKSKFVEIMNKAKSVKEDFENWKNEKEEETPEVNNKNDDDDLDDFLRGLGIERP